MVLDKNKNENIPKNIRMTTMKLKWVSVQNSVFETTVSKYSASFV